MFSAPFDFELWLSALPFLLAAATLTWLLSLPLRSVAVAAPLWSLLLFVAGVIYALGSDPRAPRLDFVLWLLLLWALRLAWQRTQRNADRGEPSYYRALRELHGRRFAWQSLYRVFWPRALQAWGLSLPLLGAFASIQPLGLWDYLGLALWTAGFCLEALAEAQLRRFHRQQDSAAVLDRGLWAWSRHPNYVGSCTLWWGFGFLALGAGAGWALLAPALWTLGLRYRHLPRRESDLGNRLPGYADYVQKTPPFLPGLRRK